MITNNWYTPIRTARPLLDYMQMRGVGYETRRTPNYHLYGRFRRGERHAFFQYTFSGGGVFANRKGEHRVPAGTGFLCRAADPASEYFYPPDATEPWAFLWIAFAGPAAIRLTEELTRRHGPLFRLPPDDPLLTPFLALRNTSGTRSAMPATAMTWERPALEMDAYSSARLAGELLLGLGGLSENQALEAARTALARRAQRLIREGVGTNLNASDLAEELGVSREHLARVFRQETGESPYAYIVRQKTLRACRYLKESALSQKEIAAQLGYPSPESFSRSFRRVMKLTPGAYRRHGALPVD